MAERLQKFLSRAGIASRRKAEHIIRQGRVTVDGQKAHLGMKITGTEEVRVDGVPVGEKAPRYIIANKPMGMITTTDDPQGRPTVMDLVSKEDIDAGVYPVGRLDQDTTGLLVITNDGELAHRLMHPSYTVDKTYHALVRGEIDRQAAATLAAGVELEDGMTSPADVSVIDSRDGQSHISLTIHEGKNRQVRRMCEAVGYPVISLVRVAYGPLRLSGLAPGASRALTAREVRRLYKTVGMNRARHAEKE